MNRPTLVLLLLLFALPSEGAQGAEDPEPERLDRAVLLFGAREPDVQRQILDEIREEIESSEDDGVRSLIALGKRARRQLKQKPWAGPKFYEPEIYAPIQAARSFVHVESADAEQQYNLMRAYENGTEYACGIRYDYGQDLARVLRTEPAPSERLLDYLAGYPPDADLLIAWLESRFDHDRTLDSIAEYFDHAYCDRVGNCYSEITIYDAFASQSQIEMSDVDVIAYARKILKDKSYRSPIPAGRRREELYGKIRDGFLLYYRHRVLAEGAANLMVNPEAFLRDDHEGLRERLLVCFALEDSDVERIRARFVKAKDRDSFIEQMDDVVEADRKRLAAGYEWARRRNESRWVIARAAYAVLGRHELLRP